jgi:hypothetical protein
MFPPKQIKMYLHRKNKTTKLFLTSLTECVVVPPMALLHPEIFDSFRNVIIPYLDLYNDIYGELYTDPEDVMSDMFQTLLMTESKSKEEGGDKEKAIGISSVKKSRLQDDDDSLSISPSKSDENSSQIYNERTTLFGKKNTYEQMFSLNPIDEMICQSIMTVPSAELRKKLANAILFVGGGAKFNNMIDFFEDRLIDKLSILDPQIERVEIINFPNVEPKTLTWIGGTILPKLESCKDMWIYREKWTLDLEKTEDVKGEAKDGIKESNISYAPQESSQRLNEQLDNIININLIPKSSSNIISHPDNISVSNLNDAESKKDFGDNTATAAKEKQEKNRKKEKHLDGGIILIREKSPFQW